MGLIARYPVFFIDVAPNTHLRICVMKIEHIQWISHNMEIVLPYYEGLLLKERIGLH